MDFRSFSINELKALIEDTVGVELSKGRVTKMDLFRIANAVKMKKSLEGNNNCNCNCNVVMNGVGKSSGYHTDNLEVLRKPLSRKLEQHKSIRSPSHKSLQKVVEQHKSLSQTIVRRKSRSQKSARKTLEERTRSLHNVNASKEHKSSSFLKKRKPIQNARVEKRPFYSTPSEPEHIKREPAHAREINYLVRRGRIKRQPPAKEAIAGEGEPDAIVPNMAQPQVQAMRIPPPPPPLPLPKKMKPK